MSQLVPVNLGELTAGLVSQFGLTERQAETIKSGFITYFNPENNPRAAEWGKKNDQLLKTITQIVKHKMGVEAEVTRVNDCASQAREELSAVETERKEVRETSDREQKSFETKREQLTGQLQDVKTNLALENRFALASFNNPLTSKVGRFAAKLGQYVLAPTIAAVAYAQQKLLIPCNQLISGSLLSAPRCFSNLLSPSIVFPLLGAAVVTTIAKAGCVMAKRILDAQDLEKNLQSQITQQQTLHTSRVSQLSARNVELDERNEQSRTVLEQAQKKREELSQRKDELNGSLAQIFDDKINEMIQVQTVVLDAALNEEDQGSFVVQAGEGVMETILNALVAKVSLKAAQFQAICSSSPSLLLN